MWNKIKKIFGTLPLLLVSVLGFSQLALAFVKEVLTAFVNIFFPIIPNEQFKMTVQTIRGIVNEIIDFVEAGKAFLLTKVGANYAE